MAGIKAIDTIYNGYRFRSRLEAKWAVYFDALKLKYEYEPEGFVLDDGICYLPDFYLPDIETYVEIKPDSIKKFEYELTKMKLEELSRESEKFSMLCVGDPVANNVIIYGLTVMKDDPVFGNDSMCVWKQAEFIKGAEMMNDDLLTYSTVFDIGVVVGNRYDKQDYEVLKPNRESVRTVVSFNKLYGFDSFTYNEQAYARQARFEHGECV